MGYMNNDSQYVRDYKSAFKVGVNDMALALLEEYAQNKGNVSPTRIYEIAEEVKESMEAKFNG